MRVFLTILEGPTPKEAVPILATEDREFVQAVVDRIATRLLHRPREMTSLAPPCAQKSVE